METPPARERGGQLARGAKMGRELGFVEVRCASVRLLIQAGVIMEIKTKSRCRI